MMISVDDAKAITASIRKGATEKVISNVGRLLKEKVEKSFGTETFWWLQLNDTESCFATEITAHAISLGWCVKYDDNKRAMLFSFTKIA